MSCQSEKNDDNLCEQRFFSDSEKTVSCHETSAKHFKFDGQVEIKASILPRKPW